ncbi:hypothetical protein ACH5RR_021786 [Cinchona calisaya]|uniref:Uncharacterized protein n=1 Tax=Cinchona calisaya TaxID=153742 RepID=A0ABD2ZM43_9GENT
MLCPGCRAVVSIPMEILLAKAISVPDIFDQVGLVVIAEVRETKFLAEDVVKQIEAHVAEEHGVIVVSTVLIKPRSISKTTLGKIKRFECAKKFIDGTLNGLLSEQTGIPVAKISTTGSLVSYGVDSIGVV